MVDIVKQLQKLNITVQSSDLGLIFTFQDGTQKLIDKKQLEQYLFICMLDYINEHE